MRISHIYLAGGRASERMSVWAAFKLEINYYLHPPGPTPGERFILQRLEFAVIPDYGTFMFNRHAPYKCLALSS